MHGKTPRRFFSKEEEAKVVAAIQAAERHSSGEIRVHLLRRGEPDLLKYGAQLLEKLGITRTRDRNGILFLMELTSHRFAILGDVGIHEKVGDAFWQDIRDRVVEHFKKEEFAEGLSEGIALCGEKLKEHFPLRSDDENEQADHITES